MSSYEFWDELGKIFNAVVAYQEKNVEFNKRFISPWIRLGNVFDKQDRKKEAVEAYQKAIELDPLNAQNWFELGNVYFKMQSHDLAADAFHKALELDEAFAWAYCNLALSLTNQGQHEEAIPLYSKGIELLQEDKDRAVAWNRLGNVYRKLNQYEKALEAFHKADELDQDNGGFKDNLDEEADGPTLADELPEIPAEVAGPTIDPLELIVQESQADENAVPAEEQAPTDAVAAAPNEAPAPEAEPVVEVQGPAEESAPTEAAAAPEPSDETDPVEAEAPAEESAPSDAVAAPEATNESHPVEVAAPAEESTLTDAVSAPEAGSETDPAEAEAPIEESGAAAEAPDAQAAEDVPSESGDAIPSQGEEQNTPAVAEAPAAETEASSEAQQTVTVVVQDTVETYTETLPATKMAEEDGAESEAPASAEAVADHSSEASAEAETPESQAAPDEEAATKIEVVAADEAQDAAAQEAAEIEAGITKPTRAVQSNEEETDTELAQESDEASTAEPEAEGPVSAAADLPEQIAYEEFLKDTNEPIHLFEAETAGDDSSAAEPSPEPVAKIDESGELEIEMDTKNAHVWNELGNVYFNSSAFDDAVVAYSKAIELDRWFAWPYSNLALTYVQKRRFVEAILLYQRSIELFASDKDKAISWNRLGNVYRRLNDYENAIAAYQRADALDPDNATLSLQSRFSLLGNYAMDQKPTYVS